ncbi:MAG: NADH-quinone oxidoreductase subunit L, partial [Bdellovibrionales bacterium]|nr:NADH-quinone oxidoreductase subunit L [Bdellovibrionales bacterium]
GACGKSAQIPLFVWLPDAMAGPTPVSALIHAATMVTAGVYMLARTHFLFSLAPATLGLVVFIGCVTAFVAATTALKQNDIKKVLAYSTVSQLGFMFMAAGAGAYWVALFHVITHAFFKACLFLCAGSVIHGCHHEQDMREMGGLWKLMPITFATYAISTVAIAGIFPFAGYYSKHAIMGALEASGYSFLFAPQMVVVLATATALLTAFYMTRSLVMTFFGSYRGHAHPHESPWQMTLPLVILSFLAAFGGAFLASHGRLEHYLSATLPMGAAHESETLVASVIHSWPGLLGVGLAFLLYVVLTGVPATVQSWFPGTAKLFEGKYFFDEFYATWIVNPLRRMATFLWHGFDQGVVDFSVNGVARLVDVNGEVARLSQTGQTRQYALFMFLGTVVVLVFCFML